MTRMDGWSDDAVAPHPATIRVAAYTCPPDHMAFIEHVYHRVVRVTAAAPVGEIRMEWRFTPSGGAEGDLFTTVFWGNVVNDNAQIAPAGGAITLNAGDSVRALTRDLSTGGTASYEMQYKISEFEMHQMENEVIEFPNGVIVPSGHQVYVNRPAVANDLYYSISGWLGVPKTPMVDWFNT